MTAIWDIHAHILPGIDDGAKNWDMTLEMMKCSHDAGVICVVATPHILPWEKNPSIEKIQDLAAEAEKRFLDQYGEQMHVFSGGELYYHTDLLREVTEGKVPTLAGSRYVLVEFAEDIRFADLMSAAGQFRRSPYRLIAAHIERYGTLRKADHLEQFLEAGAILQSNIGEMRRGMFDSGKRWLQKRYAAGEISHVASDMHNLSSRPPISAESLQWFRKHLDAAEFEKLFCTNPARLAESIRKEI